MMLLGRPTQLLLAKVIIQIEFYISIKIQINRLNPLRFKKLIQNIKDLETKIKFDELDIEFAINDKLEIFLLQVRPISTTNKWDNNNNNHVNLIIKKFEKIIELSKFKKIFAEEIQFYLKICQTGTQLK